MIELTQEQRTYDWYKARLGMFTASQIHKLMVATDLKKGTFGDTAMKYIALVACERKLKEGTWDNMSDEEKDDFIRTQYPCNNAMRWGTKNEEFAKLKFELEQCKTIAETGSCVREERPYFSASPDGLVKEENTNVEIKCPQMETYGLYCDSIVDAVSMKSVVPNYYWQIMSQMYVDGADFTYFIWYHPYLGEEFVVVDKNQEDIDLLLKRIDMAEEIAQRIYSKL